MRATLFLTGALLAAACSVFDAELLIAKSRLKLEVTNLTPVKEQITSVEFKLSNDSASAVKSCLGPSRAVSYKSSGSSGVASHGFDHPGCTKEFTIEPKSNMLWTEEVEVPIVLRTGVKVQIDVELVNPRRCGGWGCSATMLSSSEYAVK
jgi:hypothetical protein